MQVLPARRSAKGTGDERLPDAGWSRDDEIVVHHDPLAGGERLEQAVIQGSGCMVLNFLWSSVDFQASLPDESLLPMILPACPFVVDEEPKSFLKREAMDGGILKLTGVGARHGTKFHLSHVLQCRVC